MRVTARRVRDVMRVFTVSDIRIMIPYETLKLELTGGIDYANDSFGALLLKDTTAFQPDPSTHNTVADVLNDGDEYDDVNYQRLSITNTTLQVNASQNRVEWQADDLSWSDLGSVDGQVIQSIVIYRDSGSTDSDKEVVRILDDSNEDKLPVGTNSSTADFTWSTPGIKTATQN